MLELDLVDTHIQANECLDISKQQCLATLKRLNLSNNKIGLQGFINLFQLNNTKLSKIEHLVLYNCGISMFKTLKVKKTKQFEFPKLCSLKLRHANFSYNHCFIDEDMGDYLQKFIMGASLSELILVQTLAGKTDTDEVMRGSPNIRLLDFSDNPYVHSV